MWRMENVLSKITFGERAVDNEDTEHDNNRLPPNDTHQKTTDKQQQQQRHRKA